VHALASTQRLPGLARRTAVYFVCSPRARVGKTLLARLLIDFFRTEDRRVAGFDINRNEPSLADYLPDDVIKTDISETRDQMALFDGLIINDGVAKVVDVGYGAFESFFALMQQIEFPAEARRRFVQPVILFGMDVDRSSARACASLQRRFAETPLVPVHNDAVIGSHRNGSSGHLRIPLLPPVLKTIVEKPNFSFIHPRGARKPPDLLDGWLKEVFLQYRELELRLLLKELGSSLRSAL
jgi:hypothetical protein